jgi:multiple sugar transport system permease protein
VRTWNLRGKKARAVFKSISTHAVLGFFALVVGFPIYYLILLSFRPTALIYSPEIDLLPRNLTISNYLWLFSSPEKLFGGGVATRGTAMTTWLANSTFVAIAATAASLVISILAAYSLARLRFRGGAFLARSVLLTYLIPEALLFIPLYVLLSRLGVLDTRWALLLTYPTFITPFCTWVLLGYFKTIPHELEDAARIDGCSRLQVLYLIVLPIAAPSIIAAAIFSLTLSWNELLYALTMVQNENYRMVPTGLTSLMQFELSKLGLVFAASVIATIPVVALYMLMQRGVVSGLTAGAVKE